MGQQGSTSRAAETGSDIPNNMRGTSIPIEHQRFVDLSVSHWGINEKAKEFILEYHDPSPNHQLLVERLRQILLRDLWFYNSLPKADNAFAVLIDISTNLLHSNLEDELKERIMQTLLEFVGESAKQEIIPETPIGQCLNTFKKCLAQYELLTIYNSRYFKTHLNDAARLPRFSNEIFALTKAVLEKCAHFWESTTNIESWLKENKPILSQDYVNSIPQVGKPFFATVKEQINKATEWHSLIDIPSSDEIADHFHRFAFELGTSIERIHFITYLLSLPGMHHLKDYLLWDINGLLRDIYKEINIDQLFSLTDDLLKLFTELKAVCTGAVLDCCLTLGKEAINAGDQKLIHLYQQGLIQLGFITPRMISIDKDWQVQTDANHIKNIRIWMELIGYAPPMMRTLLSALIINLRVGGIFISDTDLFQRDVTKLLNSEIASFYKQIKQLCRIFPVFFTDIGAVGELRDITTAIDELSQRNDRLIHFLRKQTHAESNSSHIELTQRIIEFWYDGNLTPLRDMVPVDVIEAIDQRSEWFAPMNYIVQTLCKQFDCTPQRLLEMDDEELETSLVQIAPENERDRKRLQYLIRIYSLLREKYSLELADIIPLLYKCRLFNKEDIEKLSHLLTIGDSENALRQVYRHQASLNQVILNPKTSEGWENIDRKRHIAAGIPSMYGQYREPKFEALGLALRLEKLASRLITKMIQDINLDYVTAATLRRIHRVLSLFREGLELDGIYHHGFNSNFRMLEFSLESASFSLNQYVNIFQFLEQDVQDIIDQYFLRVYDEPLRIILPQLVQGEENRSGMESKQIAAKMSEEFYRQILSSAFLIQDLDNFVSNTMNTLRNTLDDYPPDLIRKMVTYDPDLIISPLCEETPRMDNQVFLGAKAYFLKRLCSLGFPVPPGFILTTELFRHREAILQHYHINEEIDRFIKSHILQLEKVTGHQFGNSENPLLLSVRAGGAFSMPGAMNTFLNVGMNDEIAESFSLRPDFGWAAWDCYRRLLHCWGMAYGIERDTFDKVITDFKSQYGVEYKIQFTPKQMREIAYEYKDVLCRLGVPFEENPFNQLRQSILNVLDSWSADRTTTYRKYLQIADEWGTAVTIQKMVFGNKTSTSGSGVFFTGDPYNTKSDIAVHGDFTTCSQGEDIVAGMVYTFPITEYQRKKHEYEISYSLESAFPSIYSRLVEFATKLINEHGFGHQEIEFTFESDQPEDLYLLQTRNQEIKRRGKRLVFTVPIDEMQVVGRGIGVGGGALSGILAIDVDDLKAISEKNPDQPRILVRPDTVPDDIGMVFEADGILTGRGGATSHAAVTAARLGKVCVVGCRDLIVNEREKSCTIHGVAFKPGDRISIDGSLGDIYKGYYPTHYVDVS